MSSLKIRVCKDVDMEDYYSFEEFLEELGNHDGVSLISENGSLPCYFDCLTGTEEIPEGQAGTFLEAASYFSEGDAEGILMVSVTSRERNHQEFLDIARDYPGATITTTPRNNGRDLYTVYCLLFPATPQL